VVLEPALAHVERTLRIAVVEEGARELDEDARAGIGCENAFVSLDCLGGHLRVRS
jgi:hypothetical protein